MASSCGCGGGGGEYDRQLWIERKVSVTESLYNSDEVAWIKAVKVWARKQESSTPPTSNDGDPGLTTYKRPTKVWMRWREFDKVTMRLREGDRIFRVTGTAEIGRRDELELACEEWAHASVSE